MHRDTHTEQHLLKNAVSKLNQLFNGRFENQIQN